MASYGPCIAQTRPITAAGRNVTAAEDISEWSTQYHMNEQFPSLFIVAALTTIVGKMWIFLRTLPLATSANPHIRILSK